MKINYKHMERKFEDLQMNRNLFQIWFRFIIIFSSPIVPFLIIFGI